MATAPAPRRSAAARGTPGEPHVARSALSIGASERGIRGCSSGRSSALSGCRAVLCPGGRAPRAVGSHLCRCRGDEFGQ
eukprot:scaffold28302_cov59-Phaeocystis_antarctica.AAC.1